MADSEYLRTKINRKKINRMNIRADFKLLNQSHEYPIRETFLFRNLNAKKMKNP